MNTTASRLAGVATGVALLLLASGVTSSVAQPWTRTQDSDLAASAEPTAADPVVTDDAYHLISASWQQLKADTTATTSAICDGCAGQATALHVLYLSHPRSTHLDNTAVAWTQQCQSCSAAALSVQVAVVRGHGSVTANNRALATNAACGECRSSAAAVQLVVASPHAERLSRSALADLRAWVAQQTQQLGSLDNPATSPPAGRALVRPRMATGSVPSTANGAGSTLLPGAMDTLQHLVNSDLGSVTDQAHIDVLAP